MAMVAIADKLIDLQKFCAGPQLDHLKVGMIPSRGEYARFAGAARIQRALIAPRAQQRLGKLQRERPFAYALGTYEQVSRCQPTSVERAAEAVDDVVMAVDALPHGMHRRG